MGSSLSRPRTFGNAKARFSNLADDVLHQLYSWFRPQDVFSMMRVNRDHFLFSSFTVRVRVLRQLRPWVNPQAMLDVMATSGAIISGSFLLPLLTDTRFEPGDIDIYVNKDEAHSVIVFLEGQGYKDETTPEITQMGYESAFVDSISYFTRDAPGTQTRTLNLITTWAQNPLLCVLDFDCTPVMNFLSPRYLGSFYAGMTTAMTGAIARPKMRAERIAKYRSRGINFLEFPLTKQAHDLLTAVRFADDYKVLLIDIDVYEKYRWVEEGLGDVMWKLQDVHERSSCREFIIDGRHGEGRYKGHVWKQDSIDLATLFA